VAKGVVLGAMSLGLLSALMLTVVRGDSREGHRYNSPYTVALYSKPTSRTCLARFDVKLPFEPDKAPAWEELNPDPAEVSDDLRRIGRRLARKLEELETVLSREAEWLAEGAGSVQSEHGRRAVEEVASDLRAAGKRAAADFGGLAEALDDKLNVGPRLRAIRGAVLAARSKPLVERLRRWAAKMERARLGEAASRAGEALDALEEAATSEPAYLRALETTREAYELVCEEYYELARARLRRLESMAEEDRFPALGTPLAFDASRSLDADGDGLLYSWDFGEGRPSGEAGPSPRAVHEFDSAGVRTVKLTVTDKQERRTVSIAPPPADDSAIWRLETAAGTGIDFTWPLPARTVAGSAEFVWSFGDEKDGEAESTKEPTAKHVYSVPGNYVMRVEAAYMIRVEEDASGLAADRESLRVEEALAHVRARLAKRLPAVEKLAGDIEELAGQVAALLEGVSSTLPEEVAGEELAVVKGQEERIRSLASWARKQSADAAFLRATVEVFGAEAPSPEVGPTAAETGPKKTTRQLSKIAKIFWTVEPEHTDTASRTIEILDPQPDLPTPWTYEPESAPAPPEGGGT
jgi:hypothetical protein